MEHWQQILHGSITKPDQLPARLALSQEKNAAITEVCRHYPMRINPYYLQLIESVDDPIWRQAVPDYQEICDTICPSDPLAEEELSPVPHLVHKYRNRVLLLISGKCSMYCRFCTRKRKVGSTLAPNFVEFATACNYIENHTEIRDVLLSGGDPLLLSDDKLATILTRLSTIKHLKMVRIGTRVPCTLPMRINTNLLEILKKFQPLYINTQFNHPKEITAEATEACNQLADAGVVLGCQTVLLKGVNDNAEIIEELMNKLLTIRVRPYYLFQGDLSKGTNHFRTPVQTGLAIMKHLYKNLSGMAIPTFALDSPDGSGKIPLTPNYIQEILEKELIFTNIKGKTCHYPDGLSNKESNK